MSQISIVKLSEVEKDGRFDAEFYKPEYLIDKEKLQRIETITFSQVIKKIIGGPMGFHLHTSDYQKEGIKLLEGNKLEEFFLNNLRDYKFISLKKHLELNKSQVKEGDIILSKAGRVGEVSIIPNNFGEANLNQALSIIRLKEGISNILISIYLKSHYGNSYFKRYGSRAVQEDLKMSEIEIMPIPLKLLQNLQEKIETLVKDSYSKLQKSKSLYKEAEEILLKELNLENYKPKHELTFGANLKEVIDAERIDPDYFQPKYKEIEKRIEEYKGGFDLIKNQFKQNKSLERKEKEFYNYIEISDINPSTCEIIPNKINLKDIPDNGKRKLKKGDLLISKVRPYRGAVSFIDFNDENLLGSGAFTTLQEKANYKKEVLMVFLRIEFIKDFLLRYNCGTSYPVIKDEDILNLKIPLLSSSIQNKISEKIQESFKLRKESKELLEKAKKMVEDEIEKESIKKNKY